MLTYKDPLTPARIHKEFALRIDEDKIKHATIIHESFETVAHQVAGRVPEAVAKDVIETLAKLAELCSSAILYERDRDGR